MNEDIADQTIELANSITIFTNKSFQCLSKYQKEIDIFQYSKASREATKTGSYASFTQNI